MRAPREGPVTAILVAALMVVVGAFVGATILSQSIAGEMRADATDIADDAAPSVQTLSDARTNLTFAREAAEQAILHCGTPSAERLAGLLDQYTHEANARVGAYLALPVFPGEPHMQRVLEADLSALHIVSDEIASQVRSNQCDAAKRLEEKSFANLAERTGIRVGELIDFNADHIRRLIGEVARTQSRSSDVAWLLDLLAVAVTGAAGALLVRFVRRNTRLQREYGRLQRERADELDAFASRVSHDIRSPLSAINVSLDLLQRVPEEKKEFVLERARRSASRLNAIVTDLYDFASASVPPANASTEVIPVVNGVMEDTRAAAAEAGIAVSAETVPPTVVCCGRGVLLTLLSNLVTNAIKHAGRDSGRIVIRVIDAPSVRFEVEDNGPGVPAEELDRIFEPYARGKSTRVTGLGLGLATVKRLSEAHGGGCGLRTQAGGGSTFWFEIPRAAALEHVKVAAG